MRVKCSCGSKARITKRNEMSVAIIQLYCQCTDPECGHAFVMDLAFSHSIRTLANAVDQLLLDRFHSLSVDKQKVLFDHIVATTPAIAARTG